MEGDRSRRAGARAGEVVVHDSVTVNLYQLVRAGLKMRPDRRVIAVDPADITPTMGVGITIDHAVAMTLPVASGWLWEHVGFQWVFVLAAGDRPLAEPIADLARLGSLAADCLARAVARGVYEAEALAGCPAYRDRT